MLLWLLPVIDYWRPICDGRLHYVSSQWSVDPAFSSESILNLLWPFSCLQKMLKFMSSYYAWFTECVDNLEGIFQNWGNLDWSSEEIAFAVNLTQGPFRNWASIQMMGSLDILQWRSVGVLAHQTRSCSKTVQSQWTASHDQTWAIKYKKKQLG